MATARYTLKEIAAAYGYSSSATCKHVKKLIDGKKFLRTGIGKFYTISEIRTLEKLLNFEFKKVTNK